MLYVSSSYVSLVKAESFSQSVSYPQEFSLYVRQFIGLTFSKE